MKLQSPRSMSPPVSSSPQSKQAASMMAAAAVGLAAHAGHLEGLVSFALKFLRRTSAKILENHCAKDLMTMLQGARC